MENLEFIRSTINYIEENLESDLNVELLASRASMSPFHFQRVFQGYVGDPLSTYIRRRRLSESARLLISSELKVVDIAFKYNFNSHEAFIHSFKKEYELAPNEFRKSSNKYKEYPPLEPGSKKSLKEVNLDFAGIVEVEELILAGKLTEVKEKDFSISRKIIRMGKSIPSCSSYYGVTIFKEREVTYFTGVKQECRELKILKIPPFEAWKFYYRGTERRVREAIEFLNKNYIFSEESFVVEEYTSHPEKDYSCKLLVPTGRVRLRYTSLLHQEV